MITDSARESKVPGPNAESERASVWECENVTVHNNFFLTSKDLKKSRVKPAQLQEDWTPVKSLIRPSHPALTGWPHLDDYVYIQWKERENEKEREYRNRVLLYWSDCKEKKKRKSLPANYISVWMIFLFFPLPSSSVLAPLWVFCFTRIRLPFSFYSISRIQEESKKERNGLAAILPKFYGSIGGLEGGVGEMGAGHFGGVDKW